MGALTGSISIRRYLVQGAPPADFREPFEKAIRAHTLLPLDPEKNPTEDRAVGWCSLFDNEDLDLNFSSFFLDGHILLSLRVDTLKPPAGEVKRLVKKRQQELEAERKEPLSAHALRELKQLITVDLRRKTPPKVRTVDVVWNLDEKWLLFFSHSKGMNEEFLRLFGQTFNIPVDLLGPGAWAQAFAHQAGLEAKLRGIRPTAELLGGFVGLRPGPREADLELAALRRHADSDAKESAHA